MEFYHSPGLIIVSVVLLVLFWWGRPRKCEMCNKRKARKLTRDGMIVCKRCRGIGKIILPKSNPKAKV